MGGEKNQTIELSILYTESISANTKPDAIHISMASKMEVNLAIETVY